MKHGGVRTGCGRRRPRATRLGPSIVIMEVALAVALLIGVALLIRSFIALRAVDPGFDRQNVLTMRMSSKEPRFASSASMARLIAEGRRRVGALPGVEAVGATYSVPAQGYLMMRFTIIGRPAHGPYHAIGHWGPVSPGYFEVFKIPLRRGRLFTDRDGAGSPPVVIISESLARQFFPNDDPLGHQLVLGKGLGAPFETEPVRQIVGVVGDVHDSELNRAPAPTTYIPQAQVSEGLMSWIARATFTTWVVRTRVEPLRAGEQHRTDAPRGEPGRARLTCALDGRCAVAVDDARDVQHGGADHLRRGRAAAGDDRHLRPDDLRRAAANPGDRHPHRLGCRHRPAYAG